MSFLCKPLRQLAERSGYFCWRHRAPCAVRNTRESTTSSKATGALGAAGEMCARRQRCDHDPKAILLQGKGGLHSRRAPSPPAHARLQCLPRELDFRFRSSRGMRTRVLNISNRRWHRGNQTPEVFLSPPENPAACPALGALCWSSGTLVLCLQPELLPQTFSCTAK